MRPVAQEIVGQFEPAVEWCIPQFEVRFRVRFLPLRRFGRAALNFLIHVLTWVLKHSDEFRVSRDSRKALAGELPITLVPRLAQEHA